MTSNNGTEHSNDCNYCGSSNCKSEFHHRMHCIYCKKFLHSCCNDNCAEIHPVHLPPETDIINEFESPKTKKIEEIERFKIDMGTNTLTDGVCNEELCQVKWMMNVWKFAFLQHKNNEVKEKSLLSMFRILMLKPEKMDQLVKSGVIDATTTPAQIISSRQFGWEKCDPETMQHFTSLVGDCFKAMSQVVIKQNSKINIKKKISDETLKKIEDSKKKAEEKNESTNGRPKMSKWDKFLAGQRKIYPNVPDDQLLPHLAKMGYTPETVK